MAHYSRGGKNFNHPLWYPMSNVTVDGPFQAKTLAHTMQRSKHALEGATAKSAGSRRPGHTALAGTLSPKAFSPCHHCSSVHELVQGLGKVRAEMEKRLPSGRRRGDIRLPGKGHYDRPLRRTLPRVVQKGFVYFTRRYTSIWVGRALLPL